MDKSKPYIYHVRAFGPPPPMRAQLTPVLLAKGGATIVVRQDGDVFDVSVALCSRLDNFCKRVGLGIARTRMRSHEEGKTVKNVRQVGTSDVADDPKHAAHVGLYRVVHDNGRGTAQRE